MSKEHVGVKCPECSKRMFSYYRHDFRVCGCPNDTMVDGGRDYLRYGGVLMPKIIKWSEKLDGTRSKAKKTRRDTNSDK